MATVENGIILKGTTEGLAIIIPEEYNLEQICNQIKIKIESAGKFFRGASLKVVYRGKDLTSDEEKSIISLLEDISGANIESFQKDEKEGLNDINSVSEFSEKNIKKVMYFKGLDEGECKFVYSTVRGGTSIRFNGNVVVLGDVNPGGEIVATGNVVVMGTLRGLVHAGSDGNSESIICALHLKPTQLRIADCIARCPDNEYDDEINPEMARVRDGNIYVEPLH